MKKNFSWLFVANIFKGFYQWILLILIVKYYSNKEVAEFTLTYALSAPVFMFSNLQLKSIYIVDYKNLDRQINYFLIRIITIFMTIIGFLAYFSLFDTFSSLFFLIVLIKALESVFDILHGYFQKNEIMHYMSISLILQSMGSLIVFLIMINIQNNLSLSFLAVVLVNITILFFYDLRIIFKLENISINNFFNINIDYHFIKKILYNAVPLGIAVFLTSYTTNLPRIEVEKYLGIDALAYFGAFSYMAIGFYQLLLPLQIVIRPKLAKNIHQKENKLFFKYLLTSIGVASLFSSIIYFIFYIYGKEIITLVYNREYIKYIDVLLYLLIGQAILYISGLLNIAVQAYHVFKLQVVISSIVLFSAYILSNYFLVNYKLIGASYLVVSYGTLSLVLYLLLLYRKVNENRN